jgi:hypothetical protein
VLQLFLTILQLSFYYNAVQSLDTLAGEKAQLTALEFTLLSMSVFAAGSGPFLFGGKFTEFLAPTCAACKFFG